jgi:hypothetical protein
MKVNGVEVTENDYVELARWAHHLEQQLGMVKAENEDIKSKMLTVVQQRNSMFKKIKEKEVEVTISDSMNYIETTLATDVDLTNPEQYRLVDSKPVR